MKKSLVIIALFTSYLSYSQSLKVSKVYSSLSDYKSGKANFETECHGNNSLHFKLKPSKSFFQITLNKQKQTVEKVGFIALNTCDGKNFRLSNNKTFQILESKRLTIYKLSKMVRDASYQKGNVFKQEISYYYSTSLDGDIIPLSVYHLKQSFPNDKKFHDLLETHFINDGSLIKFDSYSKTYLLNEVLENAGL